MNGPADLTHPPTTGSGLRVEDRPGAFCDLRTETRNQLFVDPAWWDVLREAYGFEVCVRQVLDRRDEVVAAVPWVEIDDLGGHRIVSLPFCDFVDAPITADAWTALAPSFVDEQTLVSFSTPASHELTADPRFASQVDGVHHRISVTDPDTMVGGFAELTRRMIRKAERSGLTYRLATDLRSLEKYYWLHVAVRKYRHGLLAQSPEFFRAVGDHFFTGRGGVLLAEVDGEVAGGCVLLVTPNAVHYKFAAANPDFYRHGVSHGLVLAALRYTAELGLDTFDFGRSDLAHGGLVAFKRRFRPAERQLALHRLDVGGGSGAAGDRAGAFRSGLRELTELYTDPAVPDELTAAAGAHLYRYFS